MKILRHLESVRIRYCSMPMENFLIVHHPQSTVYAKGRLKVHIDGVSQSDEMSHVQHHLWLNNVRKSVVCHQHGMPSGLAMMCLLTKGPPKLSLMSQAICDGVSQRMVEAGAYFHHQIALIWDP